MHARVRPRPRATADTLPGTLQGGCGTPRRASGASSSRCAAASPLCRHKRWAGRCIPFQLRPSSPPSGAPLPRAGRGAPGTRAHGRREDAHARAAAACCARACCVRAAASRRSALLAEAAAWLRLDAALLAAALPPAAARPAGHAHPRALARLRARTLPTPFCQAPKLRRRPPPFLHAG
jgi:hypothetical protein